jgi:hypothetical protein
MVDSGIMGTDPRGRREGSVTQPVHLVFHFWLVSPPGGSGSGQVRVSHKTHIQLVQLLGYGSGTCWSCNRAIRLPPRIRVGENILVLNHDAQLFPHHIDDQPTYDFSQPVAVVLQHPSDPSIWGLKNLSEQKWVITTADNTVKDVEPGRSVTLAAGTRINFGRSEGEIRV